MSSAGLTEHAGRQHGVQVELTPLGAWALLGVPPSQLANSCVDLSDLLGAEADLLESRLAESTGWPERFSLVVDFLHGRLNERVVMAPEVVHAWERLRQSSGRVAIAEIVCEVGWSHRHLVARFREHVGLPPKTVARIFRFQHAVGLAEDLDRSWAEVAIACGYCDQAHLVREFRALAGCTPTEFASDRLPNLQSPVEPVTG